jgi:hypothetical protein
VCAFCSYCGPVNVCKEPDCGIKICSGGLHPCTAPPQAATEWTCPNHSGVFTQLSHVRTTNWLNILVLNIKSQIPPIAIIECATSEDAPSTLERIQMCQNALPTTTPGSENLLCINLQLVPELEETDKLIQAWAHLHAESNIYPGLILILFGPFNCQIEVEKVRALPFQLFLSSPSISLDCQTV